MCLSVLKALDVVLNPLNGGLDALSPLSPVGGADLRAILCDIIDHIDNSESLVDTPPHREIVYRRVPHYALLIDQHTPTETNTPAFQETEGSRYVLREIRYQGKGERAYTPL